MNQKLKAIIFDYGGVICYKQDNNNIKKMLNILRINKKNFFYLYKKYRPDYDKGIINSYDYWENILKEIDIKNLINRKAASNSYPDNSKNKKTIINQLIQIDLKSWANINNNMIEIIKKIRSNFDKTAILSNMHFGFLNYLNKNNNWFDLFDKRFFSCDLKLVKPDILIFKYCLDELNLKPIDCLFIDDTEENITAARSIGIKAIHYRSFNNFKRELYKNIYS